MGTKKLTKAQLKEVIVDLKLQVVKASIPQGHCPYAYYSIQNPISDCNSVDCTTCNNIFYDNMKKHIVEVVDKM